MLRVALASALLLCSGCITSLGVAGGPAISADGDRGDSGAILRGQLDFGGANFGAGTSLRIKSSEAVSQFALGGEGYARGWGGTLVPFLHAGIHLLQLEWFRGTFDAASLSPYGELGLAVLLGDGEAEGARPGISLAVTAEHDLRFDREDDTYFGVLLGVGFWNDGSSRP